MVAITEQAVWVDEIRQIEANDPVQGGENGIDNIPHQQLANRTAFLKSEIDEAKGQIPEGETVSLASLLQMIKELQDKPAPTITQYMIPLGAIIEFSKEFTDGNAVAIAMGYGSWERFGEGLVLIGSTTQAVTDTSNNSMTFTVGDVGGEYKHQLSIEEMAEHNHSLDFNSTNISGDGYPATDNTSATLAKLTTSSVGGDKPHNNIQPYTVVSRWVRTA